MIAAADTLTRGIALEAEIAGVAARPQSVTRKT